MGALFNKRVRREITAEIGDQKIRQVVLLSAISKGKVLQVLPDSETKNFTVPCRTAVVEVQPGFNMRITGFGDEGIVSVSELQLGDIVDVVGRVMPRFGFRIEEITNLTQKKAQEAAQATAPAVPATVAADAAAPDKTSALKQKTAPAA